LIHQQQPSDWADEKINDHLQALLRHNPDIIMISKITGPLLARTIIDAAMTNQIIIAYLPSNDAKDAFEKNYVEKLLAKCGGDVSKAAELSGIKRPNLYEKFNKHKIDVNTFRNNS